LKSESYKSDFFDVVQSLDQRVAAPLYMQLQDAIRAGIEQGSFASRYTLPPEREISSRLDISRITVRKAISNLVEEGLLVRQQGSGTFVTGRIEKQFGMLSSFSEDMAAKGRDVTSQWLVRERSGISTEEALAFGLSLGADVYRFRRVRRADAQPMAIEVTAITECALTNELDVKSSLYDALAKSGHRPVRALQRLRAVLVDKRQAKLLDVDEGSAALYIERRGYNSAGQMVEFTKSWYRGDAYDFVSEINGL
jgi:GntR family transcriptional regulator